MCKNVLIGGVKVVARLFVHHNVIRSKLLAGKLIEGAKSGGQIIRMLQRHLVSVT